MVKFEKNSQLTLSGATMKEEEWAMAIQSVENAIVRCPFCLRSQTTREMLFANPNGSLSKMRKCSHCHRKMQAYTATVFMRGEVEYARFVAGYPSHEGAPMGFWSLVDHDEWEAHLDSLKATAENGWNGFKYWIFWAEYRKLKPKRESWEDQEANIDKQFGEYKAAEDAKELAAASPPTTKQPQPPQQIFFFKPVDENLSPCYSRGDRIEEDEKHYSVITGDKKQRFGKSSWLPITQEEYEAWLRKKSEEREAWLKRAAEERRRQDAEEKNMNTTSETDDIDELGK